MRVVVNIPQGSHPELLKELEKTPPRERAERLRMLATIGIMQLNSILTEAAEKPFSEDFEIQESSSTKHSESLEVKAKRQQLLKSKLSV
ncbi:hypothetical protein [Marinomonas pollencensis]|uniref:Uncharacterized protein n=1 Tax=Marinomonas pollencensis TaxID=491954 RepID=A0A3E0DR30_9GAMM|nr:hypothetical protein [Marinomonas pollencensis]REG85540.1 hypothetical protein DFP81_10273 [Marinomonas pollencensis]